MKTGFCAWSFDGAANSPYPDIFVERFKAMLDHFGLPLSNGTIITSAQLKAVAQSDRPITHDLWKNMGGHPFIKIDRQALNKLMNGGTVFNKAETEALEAVCGDFFMLNGLPRYGSSAASMRLRAAS